jgi:Flp pilus assembly protein TadB
LLKSRAERANDSIGDFNYRLDVLGRTNGQLRAHGGQPRVQPGQRAAKRRRDVLRALLAVVGLFALVAVAAHVLIAWVLFVLTAVALATYCGLWAWSRSVQLDRARKVHPLVERRAPAPALRRAASS